MNAVTAGGGVQAPGAGLNRRMITVSIMLATIMQTLDTTIANVALPHMQGSFSASLDQVTWVLTSYIVASAIGTPLIGYLCDRFSLRNVFLVSVAGFTVTSALCGLSGSLSEIVFARVLQGVFGAGLAPLSQAVLLDINTREGYGRAMAVWGMGVMVGPIIGPTLGGWLTDAYTWRWVFFINVPVGILAYLGISRYIRPVPPARRTTFDVFGFATLSIAIGALQLLLDRGGQNDWFSARETWIEAIVLALSFCYFVAHTALRPAGKSFFDYRLLKNSNFVTGLLFIFIIGVVVYATRVLLPTMLQDLMSYSASAAGLVTAPAGLGTMVSMIVVGRLVGRVELRMLLAAGLVITAFSLWQMSGYTLILSQSDIVWPGFIQGFGLGFVFVPLSAASFLTLPSAMRPDGTAIYSLVRNIGSSIGISMVETLLVRNTQIAHSSLAANVTGARFALRAPSALAALRDAGAGGMAALNGEVTRQASMIAYLDDFWLLLILTLLMIPLLFLIRSARSAPASLETAAIE